jgi:MFS family permease
MEQDAEKQVDPTTSRPPSPSKPTATDDGLPRGSLTKTAATHDDREVPTLDRDAERRLVWKFDIRILPVLAVMYLFNSLDKSNLGNAKTAGLEDSLGIKGTNKYNLILSIFFIPYLLTAPFLAILGKRLGPNRVLSGMMLVFGTCTLCMAAATNFGGMMSIRWFLGMAESAFFPLVIYYLTTYYRRTELARRLAIFYAGQSIASAFSGLLAFGVFRIQSPALESWRFLPLIEGAGTVAFAALAPSPSPPSRRGISRARPRRRGSWRKTRRTSRRRGCCLIPPRQRTTRARSSSATQRASSSTRRRGPSC